MPLEALPAEQEAAVEAAVRQRADALGQPVADGTLRIEAMPDGLVPGLRPFRATFRSGEGRGGVTGVVAGTAVNPFPNDALVEALAAWRSTGATPDAGDVAEVAALLLGGPGPSEVVAGPDGAAGLGVDPAAVRPPELLEGVAGVRFTWALRSGTFLATLRLDGDVVEVERERLG